MKHTMYAANRSAISVYGTEEFLAWIKTKRSDSDHLTLEGLNIQPNV